MEILDGALDAAANHHRPRLPANLSGGHDTFMEVVDHNFGLEPDCVVVAFNIAAQFLLCLLSKMKFVSPATGLKPQSAMRS